MEEKRLRILEVIDTFYPSTDGVVKVVDSYAQLLNEKAEVVVLAPRYPGGYKTDKYTLISCVSLYGGKFGVRLPMPCIDITLAKYLSKNKFDLIHCHSPVTMARHIIGYAKKNKIPLLFTVHSKFHEEINRNVKTKILQRFALNFILKPIRQMDYIWSVSETAVRLLKEQYGIDRECTIMRNGTDMKPSLAKPEIVAEIKQKHGLTDNDFIIVSVGRIVVLKNFQAIITAVSILKRKNIDVKFILVGDGDYKETLIELAKSLDVSDRVIFVNKTDDRELLASYYSLAKLVPLASTFDTDSLVTKEGYAFGAPAIVVKNSAPAEYIIDEHNGFLAEKTPESYADVIEKAISNPELLKSVSENCFNELYMPWEKMIGEVYDGYLKIIEDFKSKSSK